MAPITHEQPPGNHCQSYVTVQSDTAAQMSIAGPSLLSQLGLYRKHPLSTTQSIRAVGGTPLRVSVSICTSAFDYITRTTREAIYIVRGVSAVFLCLPAYKALGVVPDSFPTPRPSATAASALTQQPPVSRRTPPPQSPAAISFPPSDVILTT